MSANTINRWPRSHECLIFFKDIKKALEDGYAVYAVHLSFKDFGVRVLDVKNRDNKPIRVYTGEWIDPECVFMDSQNPPQLPIEQQTLF